MDMKEQMQLTVKLTGNTNSIHSSRSYVVMMEKHRILVALFAIF